jgi:hypothetical protein
MSLTKSPDLMLRRRPRDRNFLLLAAVAAAAGFLGIACSIALPLLAAAHHRHISPQTYFFAIYGIVALCGAASCIHTYLISGDPPQKPPHGGVPVRELRVIEGGRTRSESADDAKRHAA